MSRRILLRGRLARQQRGFSLIEVLVALVVLAVGLLGLGLLQTMNLRFTKSADQRTKAVNLAGAALDMMRVNRSELANYSLTETEFGALPPSTGCSAASTWGSSNARAQWMCEVREALGPEATAAISVAADSTVSVTVKWSDDNMPALENSGEITLETVL